MKKKKFSEYEIFLTVGRPLSNKFINKIIESSLCSLNNVYKKIKFKIFLMKLCKHYIKKNKIDREIVSVYNREIKKSIFNVVFKKELFDNYIKAYFILKNDSSKECFILKVLKDSGIIFDDSNYNSIMKFIMTILDELQNYMSKNIMNKELLNFLKINSACEEKEGNFSIFLDKIKVGKVNTNAFHYLNQDMNELFGRKDEIQKLNQFINDEAQVLFTIITGPGGAGKSKLAYEFISNQNYEWKTLFVPGKILDDISKCENFDYHKNLILVIDYAGSYSNELNILLTKLCDEKSSYKNFSKKIRLILLEREGKTIHREEDYSGNVVDVEKFPEWYCNMVQIYSCKTDIASHLFDQTFIEIKGLMEDCDYYSLISKYSKVNKTNISLNKKHILCIAKKIFGNNPLPIYILFLTDAALNNETIANLDTKKTLQYIYKRDLNYWYDKFKDNDLTVALIEVLIYATIFKTWEVGTYPLNYLLEYCHIIENRATISYGNSIESMLNIMSGSYIIDGNSIIMSGLEPDLIGEYFVSEQAALWHGNIRKLKCKEISTKLELSYDFFHRGLQDYPQGIFPIIATIVEIIVSTEGYRNKDIIILLKLLISYLKKHDNNRCKTIFKFIQKISNVYKFRSIEIDEMLVQCIMDDTTLGLDIKCEKIQEFYKYRKNSIYIEQLYLDILKENMNNNYKKRDTESLDFYRQERLSVLFKISDQDVAIEAIMAEKKYIRHIINKRILTVEWKDYLKCLINDLRLVITNWYKKENWSRFKWVIPSILIPIINALLSINNKKTAVSLLFLYKKFFDDLTCNDCCIWHYGVELYSISSKIYIDNIAWECIQEIQEKRDFNTSRKKRLIRRFIIVLQNIK